MRANMDLCFYPDENAIGPLWKRLRFPMSACISGMSSTSYAGHEGEAMSMKAA